jgi:hypothetical protein
VDLRVARELVEASARAPTLPGAAVAGPEAHERGEARADGEHQRDRDADHEQDAEAAHHRHGREQQYEEPHRRGRPGRDDRGPAGGSRHHGVLERGGALVAPGRPAPSRALLIEARLELDRVVDRQPDQHGQHRDRRHGEAPAGEREPSEGHGRRGQRERQREQPQPRAEDERQRGRHQEHRGHQQHDDGALYRVGKRLGDHRNARDHVRRALPRLEDPGPRGLLHELDCPPALRLAQLGAHAHLDQRCVGAREQVAEARLRHPRLGVVEDHLAHEVRVADAREPAEAEAVLQGLASHVHLELRHHRRAGGLGEPLLLLLGVSAGGRQLARRPGGLGGIRARRAGAPRELVADLLRGGVQEGGRAVDRLGRVEPRELAADGGQPARRVLAMVGERAAKILRRDVATQAALEVEHAQQVLGQHGLAEVALHEDDHRVVSEVRAVALGGAEAVGGAADERVRRRARLEAKGQRGAAERQD